MYILFTREIDKKANKWRDPYPIITPLALLPLELDDISGGASSVVKK